MIDLMPVKVYKTTVDDTRRADAILADIRRALPGSDPSLDLDDCDKVLRVERPVGTISPDTLAEILRRHGYTLCPLD